MGDVITKKPPLVIGARYAERKKDPPPGLKWVRTEQNDTIEMIAYHWGLRETDLALMNWHTLKREEINWYLNKFVGWRNDDGRFYTYSPPKTANDGWILVPDDPDSMRYAPPQKADVPRNGRATIDSKLQVRVVEWLATGGRAEVSGKWLYVFSGKDGKDFGFKPPPSPPGRDAPPSGQPGSAFSLRHPGEFYLKAKPDKLEYEIFISSDSGPSADLVRAATGLKDAGTPYFQTGSNWYILQDQAILKNAGTEAREKRTTHSFQNRKTVTIELAPDGQSKRYYFLLSPVQLGPEGINFAFSNPSALTPLLKYHAQGRSVAPSAWDPDDADLNVGPAPENVDRNPIVLPVIDPYAWAETIATEIFPKALKDYMEWFDSRRNSTIEQLHKDTGWKTLDHLYVAEVLKSVRDNHPDPSDIDDEIADSKWKDKLKKWETGLHQRHAEINASAHRSMLWLIKWLDGPAHELIDTTILKDTKNGTPVDSLDIGLGILHWAACSENMYALEPGVAYLKDILERGGSLPTELVTKLFKGLDKASFSVNITQTLLKGWRYGYSGLMQLQILQEFVSPPPAIPSNLSLEERRERLAAYSRSKRDNLIKIFNGMKILPVEVGPVPLPSLKDPTWNWTAVSAAVNSTLDVVDKWTMWIIDENLDIPTGKNRFLDAMANLEQRISKHPKKAFWTRLGISYALKGFAVYAGYRNMMSAFIDARYDYQTGQSTSSILDKLSAGSGIIVAVSDALAEIGAISGIPALARRFPTLVGIVGKINVPFPPLTVSAAGPAWGVGIPSVTAIGTGVLYLNVLAMAISGITTIISARNSRMDALSRGDYYAAKFYKVAIFGGISMTAGAIVLGVALWKTGVAAASTGIGATVGVLLFFVGGILTAIGTILGSWFTSDDYEVFARKCFLGDEGKREPRFAIDAGTVNMIPMDPPAWSMALKTGKDTWDVKQQKRGILNLLGKFKLKSEIDKSGFLPTVKLLMTPGLIMGGSTLEVGLHYEKEKENTVASILLLEEGGFEANVTKGKMFKSEDVVAPRSFRGGNVAEVAVTVSNVNYDSKKGKLLTTVTLRYPGLENTIRAKKLVGSPAVESKLFK